VARPDTAALAVLRENLPPFCEAAVPSPELIGFCQYYGIDFADRSPAAEHRIGSVRSGQYSLAVHSYQQPGATSNLLLIHGYLDHCGLFGKLIEYGLNSGCNVVIFDLPGHGLSSGEPAAIDDFKEYGHAVSCVLTVADLPDLPWWTLAQSTGCSALMEFSRTTNWPFRAAVFLAPLIRPKGWRKICIAHALLHRFIDGTTRNFAENSSDKDFLAFIRQDPLQSKKISVRWVGALKRWLADLPMRDLGLGPVLVLQGDADETVAWRWNMKKVPVLIPQSQISYLEGAGHQLANESESIRCGYMKKINDYLGASSLFDVGTR
jgi:alpha-beta hydrolase superfamily lysophospholipase